MPKPKDQPSKYTGRTVPCIAWQWVHGGQPVPCLVKRDSKGGFFATCPQCGSRSFLKMWRSEYGLTFKELAAMGIEPPMIDPELLPAEEES